MVAVISVEVRNIGCECEGGSRADWEVGIEVWEIDGGLKGQRLG